MPGELEVAAAWLQHSRTHWAIEAVDGLIEPAEGLQPGWRLMEALIAQASEDDLENIGAGPLERFVKRHGPEAIALIEQAAASEPKFKIALGHVWIEENYHPPDITARLIAASGGKIEPLGRIGPPADA
jgi:hypothetical protein